MSLLVLMSVSGSIFMLSGVCLQKTAEKFSLYKWQDVLFKTAIVLYLIPCPLGLWARRFWEEAERRTTASGFTDVRISPGRASVLLNDQGGTVNRGFWVFLAIAVVFLIVILARLFKEISKYLSMKSAMMSAEDYREADIEEEELKGLKEKIRLRRIVRIYESSFSGNAFTMGYFRPVIIIPENLEKQQRDIVLLHEMYHIKRNDILFKFLATAAVCIHWFNPLIYFLPGIFNRNCELNCDEMVIQNLSWEERMLYGREIFRQALLVKEERNMFAGFCGNRTKKGLTKERVENIMRENRKKCSRKAKFAMGVLTSMIWIVSSVPVFAYDRVTVLRLKGDEELIREECEGFFDNEIFISMNGNILFEEEDVDIRFEEQFVDEDGNIYEVDLNAGERAGCTHPTLVSGTYQKHEKNSSGGCVVKKYNANHCSGCGSVFLGSFISKTEYAVCPH